MRYKLAPARVQKSVEVGSIRCIKIEDNSSVLSDDHKLKERYKKYSHKIHMKT